MQFKLSQRLLLKIFLFILIYSSHICQKVPSHSSSSGEYQSKNNSLRESATTSRSSPRLKECKSLEYRIFTHQTYSLNSTYGVSLKIKSKDIDTEECRQMFTDKLKLVNQIHFTYKRRLLAEELSELSAETFYRVNLFTFDFSNIGGDAYVDFSKIDIKRIEDKLRQDDVKNSTLIVTLVTRQFLTFHLLNLPTLKTKYLTRLVVLLNGESNLELIEKKVNVSVDDRLYIEVFNSPIGSFGITHTNVTDYLKKMDFIPREVNNFNIEYIEYISKFCHITRIRVNLESLILMNNEINDDKNENFEFVKHLEYVDMLEVNGISIEYSLISKCMFSFQDQKEKFNNQESPSIYVKKLLNVNYIYLFEIEQAQLSLEKNEDNEILFDENNYLRIFIKECDVKLAYTLILCIVKPNNEGQTNRRASQTYIDKWKKIIIENSHCNLKIYSNTEIYDILDNKYPSYELPKINDNGSENLKTSIARLFNLKWFYFLKINQHQNDVEFRFMNENFITDMASNKFLNRLQQQLFIYEEEGEEEIGHEENVSNEEMTRPRKFTNRSLKFALKEADLLEYFKERLINLENYLSTKTHDKKVFFISNKLCIVNYLYDKLTYQNDKFLILFNSKINNQIANSSIGRPIRNDDCYYFNEESKIFYLTFGFSLQEIDHLQTTYFALKKQIISNDKTTKGTQKTNNQFLTNLEKLKQKSSEDYYESVIKFTRESYYLTKTTNIIEQKRARFMNSNKTLQIQKHRILNPNRKTSNIELLTKIHLFSLDDLITWEIETCWLSETDSLIELNSLTTHSTPVESKDYSYKETYEDYEGYKDDSISYSVEDYGETKRLRRNDLHFPVVIQKTLEKNVEILNYEITSTKNTFEFNKEKSLYVLNLKLSIRLSNVLNVNKKKYVLCNLKPKLMCQVEGSSCYKNSSIYVYFENTKDFSQKLKTVVIGRFDAEKNFTTLTRNFIYNSNGTEITVNKIPPARNETKDTFQDESTTTPSFQIKTKSIDKNESTSSTYQNKTSTQESTDIYFLKWLADNKLTVILALTVFSFSLVILVMLKLINKNRKCLAKRPIQELNKASNNRMSASNGDKNFEQISLMETHKMNGSNKITLNVNLSETSKTDSDSNECNQNENDSLKAKI